MSVETREPGFAEAPSSARGGARANTRTNGQWTAALGVDSPDPVALEDLRRFLVRGLNRALAEKGRPGPEDIEDFAQDATLRVLDRIDQFRGDSRFTTWAMAIAIRVAMTEMRRRRWSEVSLDQMEVPRPWLVEPAVGAGEQLQKAELLEALRSAVDGALSERQRTVILAELDGVPGVVLADRLGVKSGSLYKMYHDARKKLRQALGEAGFSAEQVRDVLASTSKER